jgi:prepilin-type N-terminal cleavage/methylation domain-containing protein
MKRALSHHRRGGFTLVEIMVVVAIIAIVAAIAVPNGIRAWKRSQATRVLEDLRMAESALSRWAIEGGKPAGTEATLADLQRYLKPGSELYNTGSDIFGNAIGPFFVDDPVRVPAETLAALSAVAPAEFWAQHK